MIKYFRDHFERIYYYPKQIEAYKEKNKFIVILDRKEKHVYPFLSEDVQLIIEKHLDILGNKRTMIFTNRCIPGCDYINVG